MRCQARVYPVAPVRGGPPGWEAHCDRCGTLIATHDRELALDQRDAHNARKDQP